MSMELMLVTGQAIDPTHSTFFRLAAECFRVRCRRKWCLHAIPLRSSSTPFTDGRSLHEGAISE